MTKSLTALKNNYPNPFTSVTYIPYTLETKSKVNLSVYNNSGQLVKILENSTQTAGEYNPEWNATNSRGATVAPGIYYYVLNFDDKIQSKKLIYLR